jgi:futalosine hydrolase
MLYAGNIYHPVASKFLAKVGDAAKYCANCQTESEICAMDILLAAATQMEVQPVWEMLQQTGFRRKGHTVTVLVTGVGQVAAAHALTAAICQRRPDAAIQAGIAGAFAGPPLLGQVVQVERDCLGDLGFEEKGRFTTLFEAGLAKANEKPYTGGWLINQTHLLNKLNLPKVKAVTVNKVSDSPLQRQQLLDCFDPAVESMEGAPFHYACLQFGLPFVQLRAISNAVGERDKANWDIKAAVDNLSKALLQLIDSI